MNYSTMAVHENELINVPLSASLQPWETVNQNTTWAPDEAYTAERSEECGQASIVAALRYATGVWTSAAFLHDLVHAKGAVVGTTIEEMVYTLGLMETHANVRYPSTMAAMRQLITNSISQGYSLIPLRWFGFPGNKDGEGNDILHFCNVTGYTPNNIQLGGVWSGLMFTESDDQFWNMYSGVVIVVHRKRMLGDH